jgi:hypothetical protein
MPNALDFIPGGYRFIPAVFQYSGGVAALPGHAVERVQFRMPVPLKQGFERIERHISGARRPLTSLCACELRSPAQFTEQGFRAFNESYVATLEKWKLYDGKVNPVARSNVCPEVDPPAEPSFHAFSFTVVANNSAPSFVIAGSAEAREGGASYNERTSGVRDLARCHAEKARHVLGEMERRLAAFGYSWADTTATQVYTVHDLHPFLADEIVRRGAARCGLTWHYARPPVQQLEYEMDCRSTLRETIV